MPKKSIIVEGSTYNQALKKGLKLLGLKEGDAKVNVIDPGERVLGVMLKPVKLHISKKDLDNSEETSEETFEEIVDGSYKILYEEEGVFLEITAPKGGGKPVDETEVMDRIKKKAIEEVELQNIYDAILRGRDTKIKIAPPQDEKPIDAQLTSKISDDGLEAYVVLTPPEGGKDLEYQQMLSRLNDDGIVYGIDEKALHELARKPEYNKEILIARGKKPIDGKDGTITYHFKLRRERKPTIDDQGRVNYHKLDLIENVKKGQVLATITLPTEGVNGINVKGEEIPCKKGRKIRLPKGKNVEISEDGLSLVASTNRQIDIVNRRITVNPVYEVPGNVDNSVGDIEFIGNVVVKGNVLTDFSIRCDGNIEVYGVVEGAKLYAKGDIIIRQGVNGMAKGSIISEKSVTAKYIENSYVQCKKNVTADAIMHSSIRAGGMITVSGRKGLIVGGNLKAGKGIKAKTIGSPMWTNTEIEVGIEPQVRERYSQIKDEVQRVLEDLKKTEQAISLLAKLGTKGELDPRKKVLLSKSIKTREVLNKKLAGLKAESFSIEEQLDDTSNSKVSVSNTLYGGVKVTIGPSTMHIKENLQFTTLKRVHGEIKIFPYEE